jgi:hypothetical protein
MRVLCPIDVYAVLPTLDKLKWPRGASDTEYGMIPPYNWPDEVAHEVSKVVSRILLRLPGRSFGAAFLAKITPGQRIGLHTDAEDDSCNVRVHVPLMTNQGAVFITGGKEHHMAVGYAYVIDPTQEHGVYNGGETDRIHLLFNAR